MAGKKKMKTVWKVLLCLAGVIVLGLVSTVFDGINLYAFGL